MIALACALTVGALCLAGLRWLRVAQREHYLAGAASRFAGRWWTTRRNAVPAAVALVALAVSVVWGWAALAVPVVAGLGPLGLSPRGRTSRLSWTPRLRRLAAGYGVVAAAATGLAVWAGSATLLAGVAVLAPVWADVALAVLAPVERRIGERWVRQAAATLAASGAEVVAVTGSYGKTSTKLLIAHLLAPSLPTVASPASFNNRMGLARAINEGLTPGTRAFVAEMGTYGPGEIAELCSWVPPTVAVMTAIGPVHLERMGSEEAIVEAKSEILARAAVGVINVDHPLLDAVARREAARIRVVRCSSNDPDADVFADPTSGEVRFEGRRVGSFDPASAHPSNVACAVGAAVSAGADPAGLGPLLATLPVPPHRQTVATGQGGFTIIDDTFNANPAGAAAALRRLEALAAPRRVVVTPGMVELGGVQHEENRRLGAAAAQVADRVVVVGETNRRALVDGASSVAEASVIVVGSRDEAVAWVREHLSAGDAVLYENDLPDHYP